MKLAMRCVSSSPSISTLSMGIFVHLPMPEAVSYPGDWILKVVQWLDYPIAVASQIMPCQENALDLWFRVRCPEFGYGVGDLREYFFNHMRVGMPVYILIFYLPCIYRCGRRWLRLRHSTPFPALLANSGKIVNHKKDALFGFCHRVAYAALLSAAVWIFLVDIPLREHTLYPKDWFSQVVVIWLDLPIAVVTQLLPCEEAAVDCWYRVWCPGLTWPERTYFYNHMGVGILVYSFIFYLPTWYLYGRNWWRRFRRLPTCGADQQLNAVRTRVTDS